MKIHVIVATFLLCFNSYIVLVQNLTQKGAFYV